MKSDDSKRKSPTARPAAAAPKLPSEALGIAPASGPADPPSPTIDAYYDSVRKEYLTRNSGGRWLSHGEPAFRRLLKSKGYSCSLSDDERKAGEILSEAEREILALQDTRDVKFCGSLAGRPAGFYEENGERFLVMDSPVLLNPAPGEWPLIRATLAGLVAGSDEREAGTQWELLLGWLAAAVQCLYRQSLRPGQALVLAGPAGCGKSVLQNQIITALLGGRAAKCAPYLQGKTSFNGDLFGAEHLMLEDEHSETNVRSRRALASNIKQICVNVVQPCHPKHRPIINLSPFWRLTVSLNDEPERLLIIPPLAGDIADKIIILRCRAFAWPLPIATPEQWGRFTSALRGELPAFLHFLLSHRTPPAHHSDRYGVAAWHHPELSRALDETAPEAHLALVIARWLEPRCSWQGTADTLRSSLLDDGSTGRDARELLDWPNACGTYLGRLEAKQRPPLTVRQIRSADRREWSVTLPPT
jgi:hypothetical protein